MKDSVALYFVPVGDSRAWQELMGRNAAVAALVRALAHTIASHAAMSSIANPMKVPLCGREFVIRTSRVARNVRLPGLDLAQRYGDGVDSYVRNCGHTSQAVASGAARGRLRSYREVGIKRVVASPLPTFEEFDRIFGATELRPGQADELLDTSGPCDHPALLSGLVRLCRKDLPGIASRSNYEMKWN